MPARRYVYLALFAVPTLLLSAVAGALATGAAAGVLWLFVYGDNPWPELANTALGVTLVVAVGGMWVALLVVAYRVGKKEESRPAINRVHVAIAAGATVMLVAVITVRLAGLTIAGPTDTVRCADFCRARGFDASGMPPRDSGDSTCTCYSVDGTVGTSTTLAP